MTITIPMWLILTGTHLLAAAIGFAVITAILLEAGALLEKRKKDNFIE